LPGRGLKRACEIAAPQESNLGIEVFTDQEALDLKAITIGVVIEARQITRVAVRHARLLRPRVVAGDVQCRRKRVQPVDADRLSGRASVADGLVAPGVEDADVAAPQ
jgi:hypothetical protein